MQRQHHSRVTLTHPQVSHHQGSHELYLNHCLLNLLLSGDGMPMKGSKIRFCCALSLSNMNKYVATTYANILTAEIGVETLVDRSLSSGVLSITSRKVTFTFTCLHVHGVVRPLHQREAEVPCTNIAKVFGIISFTFQLSFFGKFYPQGL